jgi:acyl carrier protein
MEIAIARIFAVNAPDHRTRNGRLTEQRAEILKGIEETVRDVISDDAIALNEVTTADQVPGWDSMAHINIIIAIEQKFHIRFSTRDLIALRGEGQMIGSMIDLIQSRLA